MNWIELNLSPRLYMTSVTTSSNSIRSTRKVCENVRKKGIRRCGLPANKASRNAWRCSLITLFSSFICGEKTTAVCLYQQWCEFVYTQSIVNTYHTYVVYQLVPENLSNFKGVGSLTHRVIVSWIEFRQQCQRNLIINWQIIDCKVQIYTCCLQHQHVNYACNGSPLPPRNPQRQQQTNPED